MDETGKRCCTCGTWQALTEFNVRRAAADGRQSRCRTCCRAWYVENAARHREQVRRNNQDRRREHWQRLEEHFLAHPCVDCGQPDLRVLELDHRDPREKVLEVGRLIATGYAWETVAAEIAKCDVRCVACHRIRSGQVGGSWRNEAERRRRQADAEASAARLRRLLPCG